MEHFYGEIKFDKNKFLIYDGTKWVNQSDLKEATDSNSFAFNLYMLNKAMVQNLPDATKKYRKKYKNLLNEWETSFSDTTQYFMLLGKEINYYTVFHRESRETDFGEEVLACLDILGVIKSIEKSNDNSIEIWVNNNGLITCLYLFNYNDGVVTY